MLNWNEDNMGCKSCCGFTKNLECSVWLKEIGVQSSCNPNFGKVYYANKEQVDAMLQWIEEKTKAKVKETPAPKFQVGDKVSYVITLEGKITSIEDGFKYPIGVDFCVGNRRFNLKGECSEGCGCVLHQGHDLEVIVKEKPKKTTRDVWVVICFDPKKGIYNRTFDSTDANEEYFQSFCESNKHQILSQPIKVEVPE